LPAKFSSLCLYFYAHKNKDKAMKILRAKLYEKKCGEQNEKIANQRKTQVGTGDRSERIRTYNFPQSRVTDHRIGLTLYKLDTILNGYIDEIIDQLTAFDQAEKLKQGVSD
jgi:peptide chain release factor 1